VFVLSVNDSAYLYDGASLKPITESISIQGAAVDAYMSAVWVAGKLIFVNNANPQTGYVYDKGRWRTEAYVDASNAPHDLAVYDDRYLLCTSNTGTRVMSVREERGTFAAGGYRSPTTDVGTSELYNAFSKEWWPKGPTGKAVLRSAYVRYHQWIAGSGEYLTVVPVVGGSSIMAQAKTIGGKSSPGDYADRVDFAAMDDASYTGRTFGIRVFCDPSSGEPTYSVDEIYLHIVGDGGVR